MTNLPENIQNTLNAVVKEMRTREPISSVGLFGSWSRGEAVRSSDVDVLLIKDINLNYEYVERIEFNDLFVDLDYLPKRQLQEGMPPKLDQKIYEVQILHDKDGLLTDRKRWMTEYFLSQERVDLRTQKQIVDSDVYLSRATSALSRGDFISAQLFSTMALDSTLRILMEITLEPFSLSRFIQKIQESATKLEKQDVIHLYLSTTGLDQAENTDIRYKMNLFTEIWNSIKETIQSKTKALESAHFKAKTKINYYLNPAFLKGTMVRTSSLINSGRSIEATHFLSRILIDMIESYIWLKSSLPDIEVDPATFMRSLQRLEQEKPENYTNILHFLNLHNLKKSTSIQTIETTKDLLLQIRKQRKTLIQNHLLKS